MGDSETDELSVPWYGGAERLGNRLMAAVVARDQNALFPQNGAGAAFRLPYPCHVVTLLCHGSHYTASDSLHLYMSEELIYSLLPGWRAEDCISRGGVEMEQDVLRERRIMPKPQDLVAVLGLDCQF